MKFLHKLEKACSKCTKNSINVYHTNIKRLYKFYDEDGEIPLDGKWLKSEKVLKKYQALPYNIRRHLSTAAIKALQSYKIDDNDAWYTRMILDQKKYQETRNKNKLTDAEKSKMLGGGLKELKKITTEYKRQINRELKDEPSLKILSKYQLYISLRLFIELPFRNDFVTFNIAEKKDNYIVWKNKQKAVFVVQDFKNSDKLGPREVTISKSLTKALKLFLKYRAKLIKHDFLLSNLEGNKLSKQAFSKAIHSITKRLSGKSFGSRILRIMHATENAEIIEKSNALTNKLLHTGAQTLQYIKK